MEYRIEIVGAETEPMFIQLYRVLLWKTRIWAALFAAVTLWSFCDVVNSGREYGLILTAFYATGVVYYVTFPARTAKKAFREKLSYYDGTMPVGTTRFGDCITLQDIDSSLIIQYDKIKRVKFMKDGIAITTTDKTVHGLPNREFTRGSLGELKQFLREKRPDLKIPE